MNIKNLNETIDEVSKKLFPDDPEVAKLCQDIIDWERDNASTKVPRYKEPYLYMLKRIEKRWSEKLG